MLGVWSLSVAGLSFVLRRGASQNAWLHRAEVPPLLLDAKKDGLGDGGEGVSVADHRRDFVCRIPRPLLAPGLRRSLLFATDRLLSLISGGDGPATTQVSSETPQTPTSLCPSDEELLPPSPSPCPAAESRSAKSPAVVQSEAFLQTAEGQVVQQEELLVRLCVSSSFLRDSSAPQLESALQLLVSLHNSRRVDARNVSFGAWTFAFLVLEIWQLLKTHQKTFATLTADLAARLGESGAHYPKGADVGRSAAVLSPRSLSDRCLRLAAFSRGDGQACVCCRRQCKSFHGVPCFAGAGRGGGPWTVGRRRLSLSSRRTRRGSLCAPRLARALPRTAGSDAFWKAEEKEERERRGPAGGAATEGGKLPRRSFSAGGECCGSRLASGGRRSQPSLASAPRRQPNSFAAVEDSLLPRGTLSQVRSAAAAEASSGGVVLAAFPALSEEGGALAEDLLRLWTAQWRRGDERRSLTSFLVRSLAPSLLMSRVSRVGLRLEESAGPFRLDCAAANADGLSRNGQRLPLLLRGSFFRQSPMCCSPRRRRRGSAFFLSGGGVCCEDRDCLALPSESPSRTTALHTRPTFRDAEAEGATEGTAGVQPRLRLRWS